MTMTRRGFAATVCGAFATRAAATEPIRIGSRRELFLDRELIAEMRGADLRPAMPVDAGPVLKFDHPWEGRFCGYTTIVPDGGRYRAYYRGSPSAGQDGQPSEVTCCAESADGKIWTKPKLGLYDQDNVILAGQPPFSHNFSPFLDTRPGVPAAERFKAVAGIHKSGLVGFVSQDGIRWKRIRTEPILPSPKAFVFDSQNLAFWSETEGRYVLYFRSWKQSGQTRYRWVSRASSSDFADWKVEGEMDYGDAPPEHLYTNQTSPYFRAPHIYAGICARFLPGRQVLDEAQARAVGVDPGYYKDCSDAVLVTSRGGLRYTRTFLEAFLRPGVGVENWVSRSNYPALNLIQTGPSTMSFYVNRNYGQPTAYLRRYELRLDGLASAHAGYGGGELITKPLIFDGSRLELNYSTSAPGGVKVEIQDAGGGKLAESKELIGDEIAGTCAWQPGADMGLLAGKPVRFRFTLKDADLYSFRCTNI